MSIYNIYIAVPGYLDDWLRSDYWNEENKRVEFPKGSVEKIVMEMYMSKIPKDYKGENSKGSLPIGVPTMHGKNPMQYNHLPKAAKTMLVSTIKKRFKKMMWDELHIIKPECVQITDLIYAFMEAHGISDSETNFIAIRQMYVRMRKLYANKNNVKSS